MARVEGRVAAGRHEQAAMIGGSPFLRRRTVGRAEERALVQRATAGDATAVHALFEAHFALVVRDARAFLGRGIPLEDLVAEGCLGVLEALSRFDAARGCRFMTYASWWVRRRLGDAVLHNRVVTVPRRRLRQPNPPPREVSLSEPIAAGSHLRVEDLLVKESEADLATAGAERAAAIRSALAGLTARQRQVLERRYGLGGEAQTLQAVAADLGITKERVRQVEQRALERLRLTLDSGT